MSYNLRNHYGVMKPAISIIVPSRGRMDKLCRLLACLARQTIHPEETFEVVVGLDGHADGEIASLPKRFPFQVHYLPLPHVGISAAKNTAVSQAQGDVLLFVNDDVEPVEDFVHQHAVAQSAGRRLVLGASPWKRFGDQTVFDELIAQTRMIFFYADLESENQYDFRHAWNLNLSVDRGLLSKVTGPFCEALRPVFYDDVELAFRLIGSDCGVFFNPKAVAFHNHRYGFSGYFEREALLGIMSLELFVANPDCFRAIFGCQPDDLIAQASEALAIDVGDAQRCFAQIEKTAKKPRTGRESKAFLQALYVAHLPLKRRAFRRGLIAAAGQPNTPWERRSVLAAESLKSDPVFCSEMAFGEMQNAEPAVVG